MGSGCISNCPAYFKKRIPDSNIEYTGPAIPSLGICTGDILTEVEAIILQKVIDYSTGVGINIPQIDLTSCNLFVNFITCCSTCTDLNCLMQVIFTSLCTLYTDFTSLQSEINTLLNGPYALACLSGLGSNPTLVQIIQEIIKELCNAEAAITTLQGQISSLTTTLPTTIGNFLSNALSSCQSTAGMTKSGTGASFTASFKGFALVGVVLPYAGPTAGLFDSTGLGLVNTPACGWALANGNNGTQNMIGQVPVGAGIGIMGGTTPVNATGTNYPLFAKIGEPTHTLIATEIPSTGVSVSGSHTHDFFAVSDCKSTTGNANNVWVVDVATPNPGGCNTEATTGPFYNTPHTFSDKISTFTGTYSGSTAGGGGSHNNVQPSTALLYIQRLN